MFQIGGIFSFWLDYLGPLRSTPPPPSPTSPLGQILAMCLNVTVFIMQARSPGVIPVTHGVIPPTRAALPRALPWQQSSTTPGDSTVLDAPRAWHLLTEQLATRG